MFEKIIIKKIRKYKPPIHCEDDLHSIKVGSKYLIFSNIVNPVEVNPEKNGHLWYIFYESFHNNPDKDMEVVENISLIEELTL